MHCSSYSSPLSIQVGIPTPEFLEKAWASEPLTNQLLPGTNVFFALPTPDADISLIAKTVEGGIVGQCSTNRIEKYWSHLKKIDATDQNPSTQLFLKIHLKAIEVEKKHLEELQEPLKNSFHSAGIAVLPDYRGNKIGCFMREEQIKLCRQHRATTLFCETTNRHSATTVNELGFVKIAEYSYFQLAEEWDCETLRSADDHFSVWCLKV